MLTPVGTFLLQHSQKKTDRLKEKGGGVREMRCTIISQVDLSHHIFSLFLLVRRLLLLLFGCQILRGNGVDGLLGKKW